jgi:hypothetical protein
LANPRPSPRDAPTISAVCTERQWVIAGISFGNESRSWPLRPPPEPTSAITNLRSALFPVKYGEVAGVSQQGCVQAPSAKD